MAMPSGFGQQTRLVCEGLAERGHDVTVVCSAGPKFDARELPENLREWRFENIYDIALIERLAERLRPDVVVLFWCLKANLALLSAPTIPANAEFCMWMPWEGSTLPAGVGRLGMPKDRFVHLSQFSRDLWSPVVDSNVVIPHGVPLDDFLFLPFDERGLQALEMRQEWGRRLRYCFPDNALVLLNTDRNMPHKRWDATFDIARRVKAAGREVVLVAHTHKSEELLRMENLYGLSGNVCYTNFGWDRGLSRSDLAGLFHLCDFRLSTSMGEGFGVPYCEAMATGTPQVVNKTTTVSEILGEDSPWAVPPATSVYRDGSLWQAPDAAAMAERVLELAESPQLVASRVERDWVDVCAWFSEARVQGLWGDYVEKLAATDKGALWYANRWGWGFRRENLLRLHAAAEAVKKIAGANPVVEVGSFDGTFLELALEKGVAVTGIEPDLHARAKCGERAKTFLEPEEVGYNNEWPSAFLVVATDVWCELFAEGGMEHVDSVLAQICRYQWAVLRFKGSNRWGVDFAGVEGCREFLMEHGMTRREDLEKMLRKGFDENLEHEIWMHGGDTSVVPTGLLKKN